jgi:DNA-binding NtrC family response regulator
MKTIIIIDDDSELRATMRLVLERDGHTVHEAENGVAGINLIDTVRPDLVFLDVSMPVMTGPQLVEELARRHDSHPFGIITMSGHHNARRAVTKWFLLKPVRPSLLSAVVRDFCGRGTTTASPGMLGTEKGSAG